MTYGYVSLGTLPTDAWIRNQHGGHSQFLTIQGFAQVVAVFKLVLKLNSDRLGIAWTTMIVSLVLDLFPSFAGASVPNTNPRAPA
jgi:hypothetical protein